MLIPFMQVPWLPEDTACFQPVRATHSFTHGPWYDSVAVEGEGRAIWYAKLLLLFWWAGEQYAYVQWYQEDDSRGLPKRDLLVREGCKRVKLCSDFSVISLFSIKERIRVIPDLTQYMQDPGSYSTHPEKFWYYVSAFGWDGMPPDNRKIELDKDGCET